MGSGKTSKMLTQFDLYKRLGKKPLIIKPCVDTRETTCADSKFVGWGTTKSRITKNEEPTYYFDRIEDAFIGTDFGVLFVDEAQFLTKHDIDQLIYLADYNNIDIMCYGLKTNTKGELFEGSKYLLALCDDFVEIDSLCEVDGCNNKAIAHVRFINGELDYGGDSIVIEKGNVSYKSVCRKHWKIL